MSIKDSYGKAPKVVRALGGPSNEEGRELEVTHMPHRFWCKACVSGIARATSHKKVEDKQESEPCQG